MSIKGQVVMIRIVSAHRERAACFTGIASFNVSQGIVKTEMENNVIVGVVVAVVAVIIALFLSSLCNRSVLFLCHCCKDYRSSETERSSERATAQGIYFRHQSKKLWKWMKNLIFRRQLNEYDLLQDTGGRTEIHLGDTSVYVHTGDVHHHYHNNQQEKDINPLLAKLKATLRSNCKDVVGNQANKTVPLDVSSQISRASDRCPFERERNTEQCDTSFRGLFRQARICAEGEARRICRTKDARPEYIRRYGNVVGAIGRAGIGKTTLGKEMLRQNLNETVSAAADAPFLFYIPLRNINFATKMSLLQFLIQCSVKGFPHSPALDQAVLEKIADDPNVVIILDGLDEANVLFTEEAKRTSFQDHTTPDVFLKNILTGVLFPNAKKVLSSRSGSFYDLHPECKSLFTVEVLGLPKPSQKALTREICEYQEDYKAVRKHLKKHPALSALCRVPLFCILIVSCVLQNIRQKLDIISLTDVLVSTTQNFVRSSNFRGKSARMLKLAKLALNGLLSKQVLFTPKDLNNAGIKVHEAKDFLNIWVLDKVDFRLKIFEGDKRSCFSHKTWQEFFAALGLMLNEPVDVLRQHLQTFERRDDEDVTKYLFGLSSETVFDKLETILGSGLGGSLSPKREILHNFACDAMEKYLHARNPSKKLFQICAWIQEANSSDLAIRVARVIPTDIVLCGHILPADVSALNYLLEHVSSTHRVCIGSGKTNAQFVEDSLYMLLRFLKGKQNLLKVSKIRLESSLISIKEMKELKVIVKNMKNLDEFHCSYCKIHGGLVGDFINFLKQNEIQVASFTLKGHALEETSLLTLGSVVSNIQRLTLQSCRITPENIRILTSFISALSTPMELLDINGNRIDDRGLIALLPCIVNIKCLNLGYCHVTSNGLKELAAKLQTAIPCKMDFLSLCGNAIDDDGARYLSQCILKIRELDLSHCSLTSQRVKNLVEPLNNAKENIERLILSCAALGDSVITDLCNCLKKIERLDLESCSISDKGVQHLARNLADLAAPMKSLNLSGNSIDLPGARALADCVKNVQDMTILKCGIPDGGKQAIKEAHRLYPDHEVHFVRHQ